MQESISRRHFLRLSALVSTGFSGLQLFACAPVSNSQAENKKFVKANFKQKKLGIERFNYFSFLSMILLDATPKPCALRITK